MLTIEDFIQMEKIDHQYFLDENVSPAEEVYKWYIVLMSQPEIHGFWKRMQRAISTTLRRMVFISLLPPLGIMYRPVGNLSMMNLEDLQA